MCIQWKHRGRCILLLVLSTFSDIVRVNHVDVILFKKFSHLFRTETAVHLCMKLNTPESSKPLLVFLHVYHVKCM